MHSASQPEVITLWPNGAPGSEDWSHQEQVMNGSQYWDSAVVIRNVVQPTLTVCPAAQANGTGVIVCPGGAFMFLCWDKEGTDITDWLNSRGITAFILKYRLAPMPADDEEFVRLSQKALSGVEDGQFDSARFRREMDFIVGLAVADGIQAMKVVRERAAEWGLDRGRIGVMGFSAGAMVTTGVTLQADAACRPAFAAPIYPGPVGDLAVPPDAPPLFLACASDDLMATEASLSLYSAWHAANRSAEMHIYAQGGHGFALLQQGLPSDSWTDRFADWLQAQGFLPVQG